MKIKTSELTDAALDWAVAYAEGRKFSTMQSSIGLKPFVVLYDDPLGMFTPSTSWAQAGPIIQREGISTRLNHKQAQLWEAYIWLPTQHDQSEADSNSYTAFGTTALQAAMRCFCCSKLGSEIEVPKELT